MDENKESAQAQENPQQSNVLNSEPLPSHSREWLRAVDKNLNEFLDQCADPKEAEFLAVATTSSSNKIVVHRHASDSTLVQAIMAMAKDLPKAVRLRISLKIALDNE